MPTSPAPQDPAPYPTDDDIDTVLQEFGGDARAAIRALLHDVEVLAADHGRLISRGYVRGRLRVSQGGSDAPQG